MSEITDSQTSLPSSAESENFQPRIDIESVHCLRNAISALPWVGIPSPVDGYWDIESRPTRRSHRRVAKVVTEADATFLASAPQIIDGLMAEISVLREALANSHV